MSVGIVLGKGTVFGNMPDSERLVHREMVRVGGGEGLGEGECYEMKRTVGWRQIVEQMSQDRVLDFTL